MRQKAAATFFFFQLADLDWGRLRVSVADRLTSGLSTKEDVLFKHLSPTCIIKHHRDSVLCSEFGGGDHNQQVTLALLWKPCTKTGLRWRRILLNQEKKAIFKISSGASFSNSQVPNSSPQIASSIPRTWIPKKVFGFMWHRRVKASNNCYGEEWKEMKTSICAPWERLVVG